MTSSINMSVSPVCSKNGETYAYVQFKDKDRCAEGKIPVCKIVSNDGFTAEETAQLEDYMKANLTKLKKTASGLNVFKALWKDE